MPASARRPVKREFKADAPNKLFERNYHDNTRNPPPSPEHDLTTVGACAGSDRTR